MQEPFVDIMRAMVRRVVMAAVCLASALMIEAHSVKSFTSVSTATTGKAFWPRMFQPQDHFKTSRMVSSITAYTDARNKMHV